MPIKYYCPKCHRKFLEWGAKKMSFSCPNAECAAESLHIVDATTLEAPEKPKLKKVKRKKAPPVPLGDDFDVDEGMVDMPLEDEDFEDVDAEDEEVEVEEEAEVEEVVEVADDFDPVVEVVDDTEADEDDAADDYEPDEIPLDEEEI